MYRRVYLNTLNDIFIELMWLVPADFAQISIYSGPMICIDIEAYAIVFLDLVREHEMMLRS